MKSTCTFLVFLLLGTFSVQAGTSRHALGGFWQNEEHKVVIEVSLTDYGFRAIRTDDDRWYRYEWVGDNVYTDRDGNRYVVYSDDNMVWESYDGRQLHFRKLERRGDSDRSYREHYSTAALAGSWTDFRRDAQLRISPEKGGFNARIWQGDWRFYERIGPDYFEDRIGNNFTLLRDGRLKYQDRSSGRVYYFEHFSARY